LSTHTPAWTIGVEEEYQIIDPTTRALSADAARLLSYIPSPSPLLASAEFQQSQIEMATPVCHTLAEVRSALRQARRTVIGAAEKAKRWIAAAGTHPFSHWQHQQVTVQPRYQELHQMYQHLAREQVIFGCHVHLGCPDRERAIQVMNRLRLWLTPVLALATNSPFWLGEDTGYASFRTMIWSRWPLVGLPPTFASMADYEGLVHVLTTTGSIKDPTYLYWDLRLSERFPTIELRLADVCLTVDEAVMIAGLARALAETCDWQVQEQIPCALVPDEVIRVAHWRAARYGIDAELLDVFLGRTVPAHEAIERLLTVVGPALKSRAEWEEVTRLVEQTLRRGSGATRQRNIYRRTGQLQDVVDFVVRETAE